MTKGLRVMYYEEGWRYGTIVETPIKGQHKSHVRVERWTQLFGKVDGRWVPKPKQKVWVPKTNIREVLETENAPIVSVRASALRPSRALKRRG